jgi:hypothetical protein
MIENQRAGRDMRHHSIVGSELVIALSYYTRLSCGPVSAVGAARKNLEGAGDGCQRPLRSRFQPRLTPGVGLQTVIHGKQAANRTVISAVVIFVEDD